MSTLDAGESDGRDGDGGASLFVGSFNINAEDLTITVARAWLKQAANADIVALGLQVIDVMLLASNVPYAVPSLKGIIELIGLN